jgi:spore coat protein CotH
MKHTRLPFLALALFSLSSCGGTPTASSTTSPSSSGASAGSSMSGGSASSSNASSGLSSSSGTSTASSSSSEDALTYDAFWDGAQSVSFSLKFTNASLYALSNYGYNYDEKYADVYFPADFAATIGGKTYAYADVGVRMKGNTSRVDFCSKDGTISDVCHFKISFKATFDDDLYSLSELSSFKHTWSDSAARKERKNRRFADMEKLDLKYLPRNGDSSNVTYSQEIYCYHVFNEEGIAAPKARWSSLSLQDEAMSKTSSYEAIEPIDDVFIEHHFAESEWGGDLYKCSTYKENNTYIKADLAISGAVSSSTDSSGLANGTRIAKGKIGVEDCYALYHPNYQLKTNDDGEDSDFSKMANFINVVSNVKTGKSPQKALESVLDVSEFLNFEGVSYCLGNFDDQRNNYNNYYLYFRPSDGKAIYLPYDWDWAFGATPMGNSSVASWKPYHTSTMHDNSNTNNLYWCTIFSNSSLQYDIASYRAVYASMVKKVVSDSFLSGSTYSAFAKALAGSVQKELSSVSSYMSSKTSVISSSL